MSSKASQAASSLLTCKLAGSGEANPNLPRPQHFVTRGDGSITPLIAVDELPESIRIVGVPAIISQAATLNMMDLGFQERIRTKYIVEIPEDTGSGNTGNPSQKSSKTESIIILQEKRDEPPKTTGMEENTVSGVDDVEQWRLGVKTVDETQVCHHPIKVFGDFSIHLLTLLRPLLMPLLPPTQNPKPFIPPARPRHSRPAYSARKNTAHTGYAGENAITCSKAVNTGMKCPMMTH